MFVVRVLLFVVWLFSAIATAVTILLHSGEGTGVSDAIMGSFTGNTSMGAVEKNLDKLSTISIVIFVVTLVLMMLLWPDLPVIKPIQEVTAGTVQ